MVRKPGDLREKVECMECRTCFKNIHAETEVWLLGLLV